VVGVRSEGTGGRVGLLALVSALAGLLVAGLFLPVLGGLGLAARAGVHQFESLPTQLETPPLPQRSQILAADGSLLATFYYENRVDVQLDQIAPVMRKAIVAIEDSRFYAHAGVDIKGALRALFTNVEAGGVQQGGSTITQQYVKNVLIETATTKQDKREATADTIGRKLREARYAMALEKKLSKDEILRRYLNIAYFGDGAYGIYAAAKHYFSVAPSQLTLAQAATLAGLVRNPNGFNPRLHPQAGKARRETVMNVMD
jgi:membrane peptidoglycan carboxypeptidase